MWFLRSQETDFSADATRKQQCYKGSQRIQKVDKKGVLGAVGVQDLGFEFRGCSGLLGFIEGFRTL